MDGNQITWIFGYGSLIWGTGPVQTVERRVGILPGWHREWTWISQSRHGAPTCSLHPGGQVNGVYLRLNPETVASDLEEFRTRERRTTEQTLAGMPVLGAVTHFWTMGSNLSNFAELRELTDNSLAKALAIRAKRIGQPGTDGVTAEDYIRRVHQFDSADAITSAIVGYL